MKYFQIILIILLLGGCSRYKEGVDYLGKVPNYAGNKVVPIELSCPCCGAQLHKNSFIIKKSEKSS